MEYPKQDETHLVRCVRCQKVLNCSRYDTTFLLRHIRAEHPEIQIIEQLTPPPKKETETVNNRQGNKSVGSSSSSKKHYTHDMNKCSEMTASKEIRSDDSHSKKRRHGLSESQYDTPGRNSLFRTSIEKWRPATGTIYCPRCGAKKRPLIKTRSEHNTNNSCCANCVLSCWPMCFLPFLFPSSVSSKEYLHCSGCKAFLGLYDRNNNCIRPNREFIDVIETKDQENVE